MNILRQSVIVYFLTFLILICAATNASAAEYEGVIAAQIKKSTTASNGQKLDYLKTDSPEVTVLIVEIPAGAETGWHIHPVPVYGYMLSGAIEVEMENKETYYFREGDALLEVVNTPHNGKNMGSIPAKLVVFYTGEQGKPNTVKVVSSPH